MKLPATQAELLRAMYHGKVIVRFMPYMGRFNPNAYYYRDDTGKRCTAPAEALRSKGLIKRTEYKAGHYDVTVTEAGAAWVNAEPDSHGKFHAEKGRT